jgi:hypothetical protein
MNPASKFDAGFFHAWRLELRTSTSTKLYFLLDNGEKMTIIKTKLFPFAEA